MYAIMTTLITRRGVRVVDCAVLERPSALKRSEGSNPSLSDSFVVLAI